MIGSNGIECFSLSKVAFALNEESRGKVGNEENLLHGKFQVDLENK